MNDLNNPRPYSIKQSIHSELNLQPLQNYLFDLDYLTAVSVDGEKAREFLQGQISCDMREINQDTMRQGVLCNLKGRILAALDVVYVSERNFSLILPKDLSDETKNTLGKVALFSRVQLQDEDVNLFGWYVQNKDDLRPAIPLPEALYGVTHVEGIRCYQIAPSFYVLAVQPHLTGALRQPFIDQDQYRGSLTWHALQLQIPRVEIYPESRGLFLPHRLNMHKTGYLSFEKGCYKGQEIIARMHYRSTQKHSLISFTAQTKTTLCLGMSLFDEQGGEVGELVDYCCLAAGHYRIVASVLLSYDKSVFYSADHHAITQ